MNWRIPPVGTWGGTSLLLAALIGFSGQDAPLALVGDGFAPAMWLGLLYFGGLCVFFYRSVLRR